MHPFHNPNPIINNKCPHNHLHLVNYWAPVRAYRCCKCDEMFICECERQGIEVRLKFCQMMTMGGHFMGYDQPRGKYLQGICFGCQGLDDDPPLSQYQLMYGSPFYAKHFYKIGRLAGKLKYQYLLNTYFSSTDNLEKAANDAKAFQASRYKDLLQEKLREAENYFRVKYNIPKIGEGWVSETQLYYTIKSFLQPLEVIFHGQPDWLKPQHFDIWIPSINLAVEYQGRQHYEPIDFFGGKPALVQRKKLDARKAKLARQNNVTLIYIREEEKNHENKIKKIIRNYLSHDKR